MSVHKPSPTIDRHAAMIRWLKATSPTPWMEGGELEADEYAIECRYPGGLRAFDSAHRASGRVPTVAPVRASRRVNPNDAYACVESR